MAKKYILGFDAGTSESKGTLTDLEGHVLATASQGHGLITPAPGFAEHDPMKDWMGDFKIIIQKLLSQVGGTAEEISAVGISTIMAAVTFVDENCDPLRNAILYGIDTRCVKQVEELNEKIGVDKLTERFGGPLTIEDYGPKILWVKENEPEIFAKTKHITFASGFMVARLTGKYGVDMYSSCAANPMLDPVKRDWDDEWCSYVCDKSLLPKVMDSTYSIVGEVTTKAAAETGLAEGTKVIMGTTDAGAEAVSIGVINPGDVMIMYGSTAFFIGIADKRNLNTKLWPTEYTIDGRYAYIGGMATTGSLTRWVRDVMARELVEAEKNGGENAYAALFSEAENIPAGSDGLIVLPYFQGERMPIQDPAAKGVMFGLNLSHTRGHIINAAFEGIGYGIAQNMDLLKETGTDVSTVVAVGGGTKSRKWLQVVSDICGIRQIVPEVTIGASYGDALMAALAIGTIESPEKIKDLIKIKYVVEPNMEKHEIYKKYRMIFADLYKDNVEKMHQLW